MHIVNDRGGWGGRASFVNALSRRWPEPERAYRSWYRARVYGDVPFELGRVQTVRVEKCLYVSNMLAQRGYGGVAVDYEALGKCLTQVSDIARGLGASIHTIRIGTGLGGGKWDVVEALLSQSLSDTPVYVYDLGG